MKSLINLLWKPFIVETINVVVHQLLRDQSEGINWFDGVSICITATVVFFAAWITAKNSKRWGLAILAAMWIWGLSAVTVVALMWFGSLIQTQAFDYEVVKGFLGAVLLSIPIVAVVAAIGAAVARSRY